MVEPSATQPEAPGTASRNSWLGRRLWLLATVLGIGLAAAGVAIIVSTTGTGSIPPLVSVPQATFSGERAYVDLQRICSIGPRPTGSAEMIRQQELLAAHFASLGATVERQTFEGTQPSLQGKSVPITNLVVRWHPESRDRVLLAAHYDTRPIADREGPRRLRDQPILGANDGASGTALLAELGRVVPTLELAVGVDFVLFDAEEYIFWPGTDEYFLGSEHFASTYIADKTRTYSYRGMVLVDMIGDRRLEIHPDQISWDRSRHLVGEVWRVAYDLGVSEFKWPQSEVMKWAVEDDHVPFVERGIAAIVLIDFDYPHWHKLSDTPDKCSAESLDKVGRVLVEWLKRQRANPKAAPVP